MAANVGFGVYPTFLGEQVQRVYVERTRDAFHGFECEIPLAALQAAHVGTVHAEHEGEGFLTEPAAIPDRAQIAAQGSLQIAFHSKIDTADLLLEGLQTYK
jgi:hypothetical protein